MRIALSIILSAALHAVVLILVLAVLADQPPAGRDLSSFTVLLVGAPGLGGDGHPLGEPSQGGLVSSLLPRARSGVGEAAGPAVRKAAPPTEPVARTSTAAKAGDGVREEAEIVQPTVLSDRKEEDAAPNEAGRRELKHEESTTPQPGPVREADGPNVAVMASAAAVGDVNGNGCGGPGHPEGLPQGSGGFGSGLLGTGVGLQDQDARIIRRVAPVYPAVARKRGLTGRVVVRFVVDREGMVRNATVLRSEPGDVFDRAALEAVARWRFEPAVRRGETAPASFVLPVSFRLDGG